MNTQGLFFLLTKKAQDAKYNIHEIRAHFGCCGREYMWLKMQKVLEKHLLCTLKKIKVVSMKHKDQITRQTEIIYTVAQPLKRNP